MSLSNSKANEKGKAISLKKALSMSALLLLVTTTVHSQDYNAYIPAGSSVVEVNKLEFEGEPYVQIVYLTEENRVNQVFRNETTGKVNSELPQETIPVNSSERFESQIYDIVNADEVKGKRYKISIGMNGNDFDSPPSLSSAQNDQSIDESVFLADDARFDDWLEGRQKQFHRRASGIINRFGLDRSTLEFSRINYLYFQIEVDQRQLTELVRADSQIKSISLATESTPQIVSAMNFSGANTADFNWMNGGGARVGVVESLNNTPGLVNAGCAAAGVANFYDNLAGQVGTHGSRVVGIMAAITPNAYYFCDGVENNTGYGAISNLTPHLINASFSYFDTIANNPVVGVNGVPYPARAREWDDLTWDSRGLSVVSAGNLGVNATTGNGTTELNPIGRGPNTLAIGAHNDAGVIAGFSAFQEYLSYQKPELSAVGVNVAAGGQPNASGTSFSAPHVTGVLAGLSGQYPNYRRRPALLKALAVAGAGLPVTGGAGIDSNGIGSIDAASYHNGTATRHYAWGNRWTWGQLDLFSSDGTTNGIARYNVTVPQATGSARVAISAMRNPDNMWANRNAVRPLGLDLNFSVFGPSGQYLGGGYDWIDSVDTLDFDLVGAGTYRIEVNRAWDRDGGLIDFGVAMNWDL